MVGVAVNVTLVVAQIVLSASLDAMLTLAGRFAFTVVVMPFDVTGEPVKHGAALDDISTETIAPFVNVLVIYVALIAPAISFPLSFH